MIFLTHEENHGASPYETSTIMACFMRKRWTLSENAVACKTYLGPKCHLNSILYVEMIHIMQ